MYSIDHNKDKADQTASPDKYPQGRFNMKPCRKCCVEFQPKAPSELYCSDKCKSEGLTDRYLTRIYGITLADYYRMYEEQEGLCKICQTEGFTMKACHKLKLVVDHCHTTGVVRGLLCHNCNRALGLLHDDLDCLDRAKEYLKVQRLSVRSTPKQVEAVGPQ
jgi:hypothetical protein